MKINKKYGYVRVSSRSQQDNSSIEGQKKELIRNGIPKKNIRVEVGSAADSIQNRPKFQHLIEDELEENEACPVFEAVLKMKDKIIQLERWVKNLKNIIVCSIIVSNK